MLHYVGPFNHGNDVRVASGLGQFVGHYAGLGQTVKVEVMDLEVWAVVHFADCKCWAGDFIVASCAARQAPHEGGLAATQITDQLNDLTPL